MMWIHAMMWIAQMPKAYPKSYVCLSAYLKICEWLANIECRCPGASVYKHAFHFEVSSSTSVFFFMDAGVYRWILTSPA